MAERQPRQPQVTVTVRAEYAPDEERCLEALRYLLNQPKGGDRPTDQGTGTTDETAA